MALILKKSCLKSKGVIIFTHKEFSNFFYYKTGFLKMIYRGLKISPRDTVRKIMGSNLFYKNIKKIKARYIIGVHFGWFYEKANFLNDADFILKVDNNMPKLKFKGSILNLVTRNFTPEIFEHTPSVNRYYDIINVSKYSDIKKLNLFLKSIKEIYRQGKKFRVILITSNKDNKQKYNDLISDYYNIFTPEERNKFILLMLSKDIRFPGISQEAISFFIKNTKVLTLFSEVEGESRIISEALMAGCRVCAYKYLKGGGVDYLNQRNSELFEKYDIASESLIKAVESLPVSTQEYKNIFNMCNEETSKEKLINFLKDNFLGNHLKHDDFINLNDLNMSLCAHKKGMPWDIFPNRTSDIITRKQFDIFLKELL